MDITQALKSLIPGCEFKVENDCYEGITWFEWNEYPQPSQQEVEVEIERLQAEYEHNQYQRDRASEYAPIQEQLDVLYHQGYDGWKASIDEVKNKYPKPGEE